MSLENKIRQYLANYLEYPLALDDSKKLFSQNFNGVLIRNDVIINHYNNIDDMLEYIRKNHTMVGNAKNIDVSINNFVTNDKIFDCIVSSEQPHIIDDKKMFIKVKDEQIYKFDSDDKICYLQHNWKV